jgi:cytochrome c
MIFTMSALAATSNLPEADSVQAMDLAKANGCLNCHALDEKIIGPAYAKVAAKYKNDADAPAKLEQSVRNGSQGKWGRIAMPGFAGITDKDLNTVIKWVLSIQP